MFLLLYECLTIIQQLEHVNSGEGCELRKVVVKCVGDIDDDVKVSLEPPIRADDGEVVGVSHGQFGQDLQ